MSLSEASELFHNGNYAEAAAILKKQLYTNNATPSIQHNYVISDYYTKPNPRSQSKSLLKQLSNVKASYPKQISNCAALLFNEAELHLNRHQYSKSVEIFKSLIESDADVPVNIYFRSCLRLFCIYLHHDMIDNATLIHCKLTSMKAEDIAALNHSKDSTVSSLKHSYWCHITGCHLKLIESSPVQAAYKELTKAIDLVKKNKTNENNQEWDIHYKIRILFLKAHQDFISGNVNTAKSQLFQTHSYYKKKTKRNDIQSKPSEQSIAFLNNMSCIYAINDEVGSAMSLIHRALSLHAQFMDKEPLYAADHMIGYLCYNAGLYLQNLQQYARAIDSFLCCLPVLQSKPRLWLRMAQCILAIWEPYGGYEHNKDGQRQINALVQDIVEANSTKRGDLYLLPIGRKTVIYNNRSDDESDISMLNDEHKGNGDPHEINHILKWHERNDADYGFPYKLYKEKQKEDEIKRKKRWKKRKEKQADFCAKTDGIIADLENETQGNKKTEVNKEEKEREREKRMYEKEKLNNIKQAKNDAQEYKLQIRELNDLKLAVEWLKNAISLFKKMEMKLCILDYDAHISAHLHLSYCYLKLKAWNFAFRHAEQSINIYKKQQVAKQKKFATISTITNISNQSQISFPSSHTTYLAHLYAAEALIHLNKFNAAIQHLNPINFPHLTAHQEIQKQQTPNLNTSTSNKSNKQTKDKANIKTKQQYKIMNEKQQMKQESDNYLAILVNLATTYICKDALDKAHKYIHKALTLNNEYYPALRMLVYLHMRMGNNNEAIKILKYRRPIPVKQFMQQNDSYNDTQ